MLRVRLALVVTLLTWSPSLPNRDYQLSSLEVSLMILNSNIGSTAGSLMFQSLAVKGLRRTQKRHAASSSQPRFNQTRQLQLEKQTHLNLTKMMRKRKRTVKLELKISKTSKNSQLYPNLKTKVLNQSPKSLKIAWSKRESRIASRWSLQISWISRILKLLLSLPQRSTKIWEERKRAFRFHQHT